MAKLSQHKSSGSWRVRYTLKLRAASVRRDKYARTPSDGRVLLRNLEEVEEAFRTGRAHQDLIEEWIDRKWIKPDEAAQAFRGFAEAAALARVAQPQATDYDVLRLAYSDYAEDRGKPSSRAIRRRNLSTYMSICDRALSWLREAHPDLRTLDVAAVEGFRRHLQDRGFAPWTIFHTLTALRIVVDLAIERNMAAGNPARSIALNQPKRLSARRILSLEEVKQVLEASLNYRHLMRGGLPTAVRLGLYLGLRPIEMVWITWDQIDPQRRLVHVGETVCVQTRERWTPKDFELRTLDVKQEFLDYLEEERTRQEREGLLNQFLLPAGNERQPEFLGRPLGQDVPQKAFAKMIQGEGMDPALTAYSLRHTYCTALLRPPPDGAGLDIRTVQRRMGHSDIRTTQEYLHDIEPERHPTDGLPY